MNRISALLAEKRTNGVKSARRRAGVAALGLLSAAAIQCSGDDLETPGGTAGSNAGASGAQSGAPAGGTPTAGTNVAGVSGSTFAGAPSAGVAGTAAGAPSGGSGGSAAGAPGVSGGGAAGMSAGRAGGGSGGVPSAGAGGAAGAAGKATAGTGTGGVVVGGGSSCEGKQYILCEGFEATADGAIPDGWTKSGTIAVASDQAARGMRSLKTGNATGGERRIRRSATAFGTAHWGRLFYRVQLPVPSVNTQVNSVIHSTIVGLNANRPTGGGTAEYRVLDTIMNTGKKHNYIFNVQTSNAGEYGHETAYIYDYKDTWTCAEWHVDNVAKNYKLYIDGTEITGVSVTNDSRNAQLPVSFTEIRVGWYNYQPTLGNMGFTVWVDELAVNTTRVGCDG